MAIKQQVTYICDGSGEVIDGEPVQIGHVIKRDYNERCAAIAREYQQKVDELHAEVARQFNEGLATLRETYGRQLQNLPDVET